MQAEDLEERVAAFPRWNYEFDLGQGVRTPVSHRGQANRHEQRRRYFFDALVRLLGETLEGHRVLDLGCNAGFWSLAAVEAGADFVLGVDAQQVYIDQAKLVFEAKGVDPARFRFERGNIFARDFDEQFDVVLCLGVMEVTAKPVELFELMSGVGAQEILLDTVISRVRSSFFEMSRLNDPRAAVEHEMVLVPSRDAVIELARNFGFDAVPVAYNITDYTGLEDYRSRQRLAFICSRRTSLAHVPRASEHHAGAWWTRIAHAGGGLQSRLARRAADGRRP
jgi:SAM-dependent methyltransferase